MDTFGTFLTERFRTIVHATGEKIKRKVCPQGFKLSPDGKRCVKVGAQEKLKKSKGQRRGAKKRRIHQSLINRKTRKAMRKRKSLGVRKAQ